MLRTKLVPWSFRLKSSGSQRDGWLRLMLSVSLRIPLSGALTKSRCLRTSISRNRIQIRADSNEEDEGTKSPETKELSQKIDSHVVVVDDDNPRIATTSTLDASQLVLNSDHLPTNPPTSHEAPTITPTIPKNPSTQIMLLLVFVLFFFPFFFVILWLILHVLD